MPLLILEPHEDIVDFYLLVNQVIVLIFESVELELLHFDLLLVLDDGKLEFLDIFFTSNDPQL